MTTDGATAGDALTAETLAAMEARAAAARPDPARVVVTNGHPSVGIVEAAFILAVFDDHAQLLAEVRRLTAALDGVRREERERCAKVADESAALWQRPMGASGRVIPERMETGHAVALVAVQIRALPDDATGSAT